MQKIGQAINFIIDKGLVLQTFTSSAPFTVPAGNGLIAAYGWGGGAGAWNVSTSGGGDSHFDVIGQAAVPTLHLFQVTKGDVLTINVGAGGSGGDGLTAPTDGGASSVYLGPTQLAYFGGAQFLYVSAGGGVTAYGGNRIIGNYPYGTGGGLENKPGSFWGGNGGPGGPGGNVSNGGVLSDAPANSGAGGGASRQVTGNRGGNGGSGKVILFYL